MTAEMRSGPGAPWNEWEEESPFAAFAEPDPPEWAAAREAPVGPGTGKIGAGSASAAIPAGRLEVEKVPLLASHGGAPPALVLRWTALPAAGPVDVVVHLHGYSAPGARMRLTQSIEPISGLDLRDPDGGASGERTRPTVLLLPRGKSAPSARRSDRFVFPALVAQGAVDALVQAALALLGTRTGVVATRGRLILTAHSGGGDPLNRILAHTDPDEVYVFDGLYGSATNLAAWAVRRIKRELAAPTNLPPAMRVLYRPGTAAQSTAVAKAVCAALAAPGGERLAPRFRVERTSVGHMQIPRRYGWRLLTDAGADAPATQRVVCSPQPRGLIDEPPQEEASEGFDHFTPWVTEDLAGGVREPETVTETEEGGDVAAEQYEDLADEAGDDGSFEDEPVAQFEFEDEFEDDQAEDDDEFENQEFEDEEFENQEYDQADGDDGSEEAGRLAETKTRPWQGTADQVAFRERVLAAAIARRRDPRRKGSRPEQVDLPATQLRPVPGTNVAMRADAAEAAGRMLRAANADLAAARASGHPDALKTLSIGAVSGYRARAHQEAVWRRVFSGYYDQTHAARSGLTGGPHGAAAVTYLLDTFRIPARVAAPGYSNHQNGIAIDLAQARTKGHPIRNSTQKSAVQAWQRTWFFDWLNRRPGGAEAFGFTPYQREPWHWEYTKPPTQAGRPMTAQELDEVVRALTEEADAGWERPLPAGLAWTSDEGLSTEEDREAASDLADIAERVASQAESFEGESQRRRPVRRTTCFTAADVQGLRQEYADNLAAVAAGGSNDRASCIVMLNVAVGRLLSLRRKSWPARSKSTRRVQMADLPTHSVERSLARLVASGEASRPVTITFLDASGRRAGTTKPDRLRASVSSALLARATKPGCFYAFATSLMDGYHSVLILVDRTGAQPVIEWFDQFSPRAEDQVTTTLDARITEFTTRYWQQVKADKGIGFDTPVRLWQLRKPG